MSILFHALLTRGICDVPDSPECGVTAWLSLVVGLGFVSSTALQVIPCVGCTAGPEEHHPPQRLDFGLGSRACGVSIGAVCSPAGSVGCAADLPRAEQALLWLEAVSSLGSVRLEGGEVQVRWVSPMDVKWMLFLLVLHAATSVVTRCPPRPVPLGSG